MRAVVVAHPDDEALWLSAALARAERVVFCFGDQSGGGKKSAARRRAVAALGLPGLISLGLTESGTRKLVDWANARFTAAGIEIFEAEGRARYEANFTALVAGLRPQLAGCGLGRHEHRPGRHGDRFEGDRTYGDRPLQRA